MCGPGGGNLVKGAQKGRSEYRASWGKGNSGLGLETGATGLAGGRGLLRKHSVTLVWRARPSCSRPGAEHPSRQGPAAVCREGSGHLVEAWFLCQWLHGRHPGQCPPGGQPGRAPGRGAAGLRPAPGPGEERRR